MQLENIKMDWTLALVFTVYTLMIFWIYRENKAKHDIKNSHTLIQNQNQIQKIVADLPDMMLTFDFPLNDC